MRTTIALTGAELGPIEAPGRYNRHSWSTWPLDAERRSSKTHTFDRNASTDLELINEQLARVWLSILTNLSNVIVFVPIISMTNFLITANCDQLTADILREFLFTNL